MAHSTLQKIERFRKKLIVSIARLRAESDPDARALALLHEFTVDALTRLPRIIEAHATEAGAIILTQREHQERLARFALDVLALQAGGSLRGKRRKD